MSAAACAGRSCLLSTGVETRRERFACVDVTLAPAKWCLGLDAMVSPAAPLAER